MCNILWRVFVLDCWNMFKCVMCGMCCRNINRYRDEVYPILKEILGATVPKFDIEDDNGACVYLTKDNKCSIYEQRPVLCNTEKMFELLSKALNLRKSELYQAQNIACKIDRQNSINLKTKEHGHSRFKKETNCN